MNLREQKENGLVCPYGLYGNIVNDFMREMNTKRTKELANKNILAYTQNDDKGNLSKVLKTSS